MHIKPIVVAFATLAMTGQTLAADMCARPNEAMALKTAAVQQELMVAALTCGDAGAYNSFVLSHRHELQRSDAELQSYFQRTRSGDDGYNAYKTALANDSSLASLHGQRAFCAQAEAAFYDAYNTRSLESFVAARPRGEEARYPVCEDQTDMVAGGSSAHASRR
ncbi:MAG TPA: hypothetical protein VGF56_03755 [Rhizomicrobium sp.]|jgi:hypothetical protein